MHLGDEAFYLWLNYLCSRANNVLIEPQPKRCYTGANKRLRKMGRPEVNLSGLVDLEAVEGRIEEAVVNCGFEKLVAGEEEREKRTRTEWGRKLMLFRRVIP